MNLTDPEHLDVVIEDLLVGEDVTIVVETARERSAFLAALRLRAGDAISVERLTVHIAPRERGSERAP